MTALTHDRNTEYSLGDLLALPVAANQQIFAGTASPRSRTPLRAVTIVTGPPAMPYSVVDGHRGSRTGCQSAGSVLWCLLYTCGSLGPGVTSYGGLSAFLEAIRPLSEKWWRNRVTVAVTLKRCNSEELLLHTQFLHVMRSGIGSWFRPGGPLPGVKEVAEMLWGQYRGRPGQLAHRPTCFQVGSVCGVNGLRRTGELDSGWL